MELDIYNPSFEPTGYLPNIPPCRNYGKVRFIEALLSLASGVVRPRNSTAVMSI